ncbi:response regulator transcription factor [uncultured Microbulbifer sp.]|uniref:response regulator transcription factor n=1 Tax=uncultured Microbulbifer sp. TaxID=348147 RepID=UPI00262928F8|nr:response regulator transcription factor [uncultured Microbulbifer sp.]
MRILLVEDEPVNRSLIVEYLNSQEHQVDAVGTGEEARKIFFSRKPDIVLLDILLPDCDGLALIDTFRRSNPRVGIIMISKKSAPVDRVVGLEMGADDYLPKPFELPELSARIKALKRRDRLLLTEESGYYQFNHASLDFGARSIRYADGTSVALSDGEYRVLAALTRASGKVVPRDRLLNILRTDGEIGSTRSLDVIISRLRTKLKHKQEQQVIITVHRVGYRIVETNREPLLENS